MYFERIFILMLVLYVLTRAFFLTDGEFESLFAARINCSAKCSSIGLGLENVASLTESAINFKAMSTLRIGATSTDTWYVVPP